MFKYIIFEHADGMETIRIFDTITKHCDVAREVGLKVISAGKIDLKSIDVINGSVSLDKKFSLAQSCMDEQSIMRLNNLS